MPKADNLRKAITHRWKLLWPDEEPPDLTDIPLEDLEDSYHRIKWISMTLMYGGSLDTLKKLLDSLEGCHE